MSLQTISPSLLAFATGDDVTPIPTPGFAESSRMYVGLTSSQYHGDKESLSCSMLKPILTSPAHFQTNILQMSTSTKAKDFGSLVHALVLEPQTVGSEFALYPGVYDGRSSSYKDFLAQNPGRLVVDEPTFRSARRLADKVLNRKVMGRLFGDFVAEGIPEASIYFEEPVTGVMLKIRPDLYHPDFTFDLKTTRHATVGAFIKDGISLDYDMQSYMYSLGRAMYEGTSRSKPFIFIAAESAEPFSVHVVTAGESFMGNGMKKFTEALTIFKACTDSGYFPDASGEATAEITYWDGYVPDSTWKASLSG